MLQSHIERKKKCRAANQKYERLDWDNRPRHHKDMSRYSRQLRHCIYYWRRNIQIRAVTILFTVDVVPKMLKRITSGTYLVEKDLIQWGSLRDL